MREHARIEELIAIRSLGGLDPQDQASLTEEMASHGPDCAECLRLEADYAEVAGGLALALDPVAVRSELLEETVARLHGASDVEDRAVDGRAVEGGAADEPGGRRSRGSFLRPLVAVAAALVLFVGGWAIGAATSGDDGTTALEDPTVVAFQGDAEGSLAVAYTPGESGAYLLGSGLSTPPAGSVYQAWMISGEVPTPGPCFVPSSDGSLFTFVDGELAGADVMAVTVEPAACSTMPTTTPVFVAEIQTV
jgi:hypothetical protein